MVNLVNFSVDGSMIISTDDETIKLWDSKSGLCIKTLYVKSKEMHKLGIMADLSADGKYIVSTSGSYQLLIWDVGLSKCIQTLEGHDEWVSYVNFSNDGGYILSTSIDGAIKVWDTKSGNYIKTFKHTSIINSAIFSNDSKYILSASYDGCVNILNFGQLNELIKFSHEQFKNNPLTKEERKEFYLE